MKRERRLGLKDAASGKTLVGVTRKPNSVPDYSREAIIYLAHALLHGSSDLPGDLQSEQPYFLSKQRTISLFDLASGVVCLANPVTRNAVSSYLTFSPLPIRRGGQAVVFFFVPMPSQTSAFQQCGILCCPDFTLSAKGRQRQGQLLQFSKDLCKNS